ncbi:cyclic dehypoxanthinyl futalosine synthase [Candidatus Methylomirabilis sp.]|uniref:cyclic dehypoxanthinyl futalosine synthase n=1 Tax=Candidatus Methylomirabilis sp. TaxID=2032687 RepID=UPI002A66C96F|nr:dehypoxanthine futalosine cyclase [Candidatus Methylomirabilis sp.]
MAESNGRIEAIAEKVETGERLSFDDGVDLFDRATLLELSAMADCVRWRLHPEPVVTYVIGRTVNYTNICWVQCSFCAFYRLPTSPEAYLLSKEEIFQKIEELIELGGTEVLLQGGLNPSLKIDYYEDLLTSIKARFPVHLHALSTVEISYISNSSKLSLKETLKRLKAAGLDSIPGAGAELLVDEVRQRVSPLKESASDWLNLMQIAHGLGIPSSATMMYGVGETSAQRVEHLVRIRELQDRTGGFTAFIPWSYQPNGDALGGTAGSGYSYLRTVAVSRVMLDNVEHIQAAWLTMGPKIGQLSLQYGVNDFGSSVLEENVVKTAVTRQIMPLEEIRRNIRDAGFVPKRRNTRYELLE